jgi:hypothetical protein
MKKQLARKLSLQTETVMKLSPEMLGDVHGGATPAVIFTASVRFCIPVGNAILTSAQRSCVTCRCR